MIFFLRFEELSSLVEDFLSPAAHFYSPLLLYELYYLRERIEDDSPLLVFSGSHRINSPEAILYASENMVQSEKHEADQTRD